MSSTVFRILVTRRIPREAIDILATKCNIDVWDSDECIPNQTLHKRIEGIDGLFCLLTDKIGSATLDAAGPSLKVVSTMSVGVDHIDLRECARRNINIGYTPDVLTAATAEFTLALLLATSRRIVEATREAQSGGWGTWKPTWLCGPSLLGGTVGIVGLGRIGIATLERLRPFGPKKFLYNNTKRRSIEEENELSVEYATLDDLLKRSDFVLCLCALTPESTNLFNREAFNKMKRTAIFINTASDNAAYCKCLVANPNENGYSSCREFVMWVGRYRNACKIFHLLIFYRFNYFNYTINPLGSVSR
ncbi:glyoxylate reductase/hydroxypyruvate reductase-like isoform X2 [Styela clava]